MKKNQRPTNHWHHCAQEKIGQQCLYFSRPFQPWGITESWEEVSNVSHQIILPCYLWIFRPTRASTMLQCSVQGGFNLQTSGSRKKTFDTFQMFLPIIFPHSNESSTLQKMEDIWQRRLKMLTKLLNFVNIFVVSFGQEFSLLRSCLAGSCTPSLVSREGRCFQWSPLDGQAGLFILILVKN